MSSEKLNWNEEKVSQILAESINKKNQLVEPNYIVSQNIRFIDNYWDLSAFNKRHSNSLYKFDFSKIRSISFRILLKKAVIRDIYFRKNTIKTTKTSFFSIIYNLILYFENEAYIWEPDQITPGILKSFIVSKYSHLTERSIKYNLSAFKKFFEEIELNTGMKIKDFIPIFNMADNRKIKAQIESNKTPNIPEKIYERIKDFALRDMYDEQLIIPQRIAACMIMILSHTGMRRGELCLLEADRLNEILIKNGKKKVHYLEFFTYKTTINDGKWTQTFTTKEMIEAYKLWEKLTKDVRSKFNSPYLYINWKTGERMSSNAIKRYLRIFMYRHYKEFEFESLSDFEIEQLNTEVLTINECRYSRYYKKKDIGKEIWYVNPHQFRVAIANKLRENGTPLQWIRRHMNHLDEEMTKHYFRDDDHIKKTLFSRVDSKGERLETNPKKVSEKLQNELQEQDLKQAYDIINKFLKTKKFKVYSDIDIIINILKNNPLRETSVGFCTKALGSLCDRQERLELLERWQYINPSVPDLSNFDFTIKRFIEKCKIVKHNKKIFEQDSKYERQFSIEYKVLKSFYSKCVLISHKTLLERIKNDGANKLITLYPNLTQIISNIDIITKELEIWKKKLEL